MKRNSIHFRNYRTIFEELDAIYLAIYLFVLQLKD